MDQVVERMDELTRSFISTLCKLENQHNGLCNFAYDIGMKKLEAKFDQAYIKGDLTGFVLALNNLRNEWLHKMEKFTQMEMFK
jgi:hypothetical protein